MKEFVSTFESAFKDLCSLNSQMRMAEVFDLWLEMCALALRNQACKLRGNDTEWQDNETRYLKSICVHANYKSERELLLSVIRSMNK